MRRNYQSRLAIENGAAEGRVRVLRSARKFRGQYPYFSVLMIDHNVMRLYISMHDSLAMAEVQGFEELQDVKPDIQVIELGVQAPEVGVVDKLKNERWRLALI